MADLLSNAERTMLTYALDQAQEKIWSEDGFTDEDQAAVDSLRRIADEAQQPERVTLTRDQLAALLAHHADVLATQLRAAPARDGWIAAERLDAHAAALTDDEEPPAVAELLDAIWTFPVERPAVEAQQPKEA